MKKVAIITGVSSFLGRSLASYLIANGFIVYGIIRPSSKRLEGLEKIKNLILIPLDFDKIKLDDFDKISIPIINDADISLIHFAWGATLDRNNFASQMYNIDYSMKVLEFAKCLKVNRFIFAGSQAEKSSSAYGMAKKEFASRAEAICKSLDVAFIHLRIYSIYGKGDRDTSLIKTLVNSIKHNQDISLSSCNYMWNFLFIDDFVMIINKLIENNTITGTYDIASDDTRLLKDYVIEAYKVLNGKNKLKFGDRHDSSEKFAIPNIKNTIVAIGDFKFTDFSEGILTV